MACTVRDVYRVLLLVYGVCAVAVVAKGSGGPRRPVSSLNEHQHRNLCSLLQNCTIWCSDCSGRSANNLFHSLDSCDEWKKPVGIYQHVFNCPPSSSYVACISANNDGLSRSCTFSNRSDLVCFSQENDDIHIWPETSNDNPLSLMLLEETCPSCSCSTKKPTTPLPPTTATTLPTIHFGDPIDAKPTPDMTTAAGNTKGPDLIVIIAAAVGGCLLLLLIIISFVCYQRKCRGKNGKNVRKEEEYAYVSEMTLRSQASVMNSQQLVSNPNPCGHHNFNNDMYGLNGFSNAPALLEQPPELPGNHPPPSKPAPAPYQELNRGRLQPTDVNAGTGGGQCPRCRQMAAERSATAPVGLDGFPAGAASAGDPYMALMKTNTCPTPGTPQTEPICKCHARPLSECSSVTGSVMSEPQGGHGQAADTLNSTDHDSDWRPLSGSSDINVSPYYFKMQTGALPCPQSPQYFKLEEAKTLPLDDKVSEVTPMLPNPDSNENNVKSVSKDERSIGTDANRSLPSGPKSEPCVTVQSEGSKEQDLPKQKGTAPPTDGPVEDLANRNDKVHGTAMESTV